MNIFNIAQSLLTEVANKTTILNCMEVRERFDKNKIKK